MGKFNLINEKLNKIAESLIMDDDFVKLIYYSTPDALSREPLENKDDLIYKSWKPCENNRIYVLPFIPDVTKTTGVKLNICIPRMKIDNSNRFFVNTYIKIFLVCHYDSWQLDSGVLRPNQIAERLDSIFNFNNGYGMGRLVMDYFEQVEISGADKVYGCYFIYKVQDLNISDNFKWD